MLGWGVYTYWEHGVVSPANGNHIYFFVTISCYLEMEYSVSYSGQDVCLLMN